MPKEIPLEMEHCLHIIVSSCYPIMAIQKGHSAIVFQREKAGADTDTIIVPSSLALDSDDHRHGRPDLGA